MLKRKKLIKELILHGRDFWGNKSSIIFEPTDEPGIYLQTKKDGVVPIDFRIAKRRKGRINLEAGGTTLPVYEHIGGLRFAGFDNFKIIPVTPWPPYLGGMRGFLPGFLLEGYTEEDGVLPIIQPNCLAQYESGNRINSETGIYMPSDSKFSLLVQAKWSPLPSYVERVYPYTFTPEQWMEFWNAKPQGFPSYRKKVAKFLKWPNMGHVAWMDDFSSPTEASRAWWKHRVQDILGCLSLASHTHLPLLHYQSFCAGHKEDLKVLTKAFS